MTRLSWCLAVILVGCVALAMSATSTPNPRTSTGFSLNDDDDEDIFVPFPGQRFDNFDWQLCKALDKRDSGNVILSPIGIKLVLAMLYEGAAGETAREIQMSLQLPLERFYVRRNYSNILASLQATRPEYVLDIGTKMYTDERNKIRKTYNDVLQTYYNSRVESIDFSDTNAAANKINSWVEAVTHGKIQHLVTDGTRDEPVARQMFTFQTQKEVRLSGTVICEEEPWLSASPDGLIGEDTILEIKCPNPDERPLNLTKLGIRNNSGNLQLLEKGSRGYYMQVQIAMHCTKRTKCIFYVWTVHEQHLIKVPYNRIYVLELIIKLKMFYFSYYLPALADSYYKGDIKLGHKYVQLCNDR